MILSCHVRQLSWIKTGGNPPAFPESAVISQLREVGTGTARSVPPVRLNQGAFLAFITVEYLDSIAGTIYGWFPLLDGAAGCWGAKRSFSPTSYLGGTDSLLPLPETSFPPQFAADRLWSGWPFADP